MRSLPRFMVVATIAGVVASMNIRADLPPEHDGQFTPNAPGEPRLCRLYFDPIRPASLKNPRKAFHGLSPEEIVDIVADMGTEMWAGGITWNGSPFGGDYQGVWFPSEMVRQSEKVPFEHIQRVVKRAKEYGIIYQGCQQLSDVENQDLEGNMIDWAIHPLGGGEPNSRWLSYACKGFEEWTARHMAEHLTTADLDGFWFDGSPFAQRIGWPWPTGDIGPCGAESFKLATGQPPPDKEDWKDPVFRQWVKWRYDTTVRFMQSVSLHALQFKEDASISIVYNMHNCDWQLGLPMRDLSEMAWYPGIHDEASILGRLGRALSPRASQWFWAQWHNPKIVHGEGPYFDPGRTMAKCLRAVAHGTAPSVGGWHADIQLWQGSMKTIFSEIKKRKPYFGGESLKYAALVISQQTRDYRRDKPSPYMNRDFWHSVKGFNEIQNARNLLTDVLFDEAITTDALAPYKVVLLPNVYCLSNTQCEALRSYVAKGGHLIATMGTSLYDEWGNPRENFALADLFGVDYVGTGPETHLLVPRRKDFEKKLGKIIGFKGPSVEISLREEIGTEVLFSRSSVDNLNGLSIEVEEYVSDRPEIVRTYSGAGTATYVSIDLGHGYEQRAFPNLATMAELLQTSVLEPPVRIDPTALLETTGFRRGNEKLILHLVNLSALHSGSMTPLGNIGITLTQGTLRSARRAITGESLQVKNNRHVVVPSIDWGEVLVLNITP